MIWQRNHWLRRYLANSLWVLPTVGILAAMVLVRITHRIDMDTGWVLGISADTTRAVLGTLAASLFTFIVFVSSALLVAVQLASAQLTPLIIGLLFKDPLTKLALTLFSFAFTFSLAALFRMTTTSPWLTSEVAAYTSVVSLVVFFYLIDHVGKALRPSGALRTVGKAGRRVIDAVYPHPLGGRELTPAEPQAIPEGESNRTVANPQDGVIVAVEIEPLLRLATQHDCRIELVPQIGSYVMAGQPLFRMFGGGTALPKHLLCGSVYWDQDRTLEQDPMFALRIMVDIAIKAVSPAINDPTTGVLAIDHIQHLLRVAGSRLLDDGVVRDGTGQARVIVRKPQWEDFVSLAVTEIRQCGSRSIQIARRLRAMIEELIETLPATRSEALRRELDVLQATSDRSFAEPADGALARIADPLGIGGPKAKSNGAPRRI